MGAVLTMLAGMRPRGVLLREEGRLAAAEVTPCLSRSAGQPWLPSSQGDARLLPAMFSQEQTTPRAWLPLSPAFHPPRLSLFSGDQSLLSLSLAPFDASLHGCKAVLASHCSNSSEVIPVPASIERMGLEGGSPAAPRFLLSV